MLDLNKCELIETRVANLLSSISILDEGVPMVYALENGVEVVKPAAGVANEIFMGISIHRSTSPLNAAWIERFTVPSGAPYTVTLSKINSGSALGLYVINSDGSTTQLTAGNPGSVATEYSISGQVITLNSAQAGKTVQASYRYAPTLVEANYRYAFNPFTPVALGLPTTGLGTTGDYYTDCFDPTANWAGFSGATPIKLGNGVFTIGGNGITIPAIVSAVPGVDSPLLGLRINPV